MSSSMSRSKSRWRGALLAAVSAAVIVPATQAATGSMVVSLSLSPLGSSGYKSTEYIAPTGTVPIYVYATVTGSSAITPSEIDGLEYLYYNVNQAIGTAGVGSITAATPNAALHFNANGSQGGTLHSTGTIAVGGTTLTDYAKPRSSGATYSTVTPDGTNVILSNSNKSVSFLVETLTYTPTFTPKAAVAGTADSTSFSLSIPSSASTAPYFSSNYFTDLTSQPGTGLSPGAANTFNTGYTASPSSVTLIDGEQGDVNLDGIVNGSDAAIISSAFNTTTTGYTNGDLTGDGIVNGSDAALVSANFNVQYSTVTPTVEFAGATAQIGAGSSVPEPASLGLIALAGASLFGRRRRTV